MNKEKIQEIKDKFLQLFTNHDNLKFVLIPFLLLVCVLFYQSQFSEQKKDMSKLDPLKKESEELHKTKKDAILSKQKRKNQEKNKKRISGDSFLMASDEFLKDEEKPVAEINSNVNKVDTVYIKEPSKKRSKRKKDYFSSSHKRKEEKESTKEIFAENEVFEEEAPVVKKSSRTFETIGSSKNNNSNNSSKRSSSNRLSIKAIIHNRGGVVKNGSSVRIRVLEETKIGDYTIPENKIITAIASLGKERVSLIVKSLRIDDNIIPIDMQVYEMDGIKGIYTRDLLKYDIGNDVADNGIENANTQITLPGGLGGLSTNIGKKKKNEPSVKLPEGHQILLIGK